MARIKITKRVKVSAKDAVRSQVAPIVNPGARGVVESQVGLTTNPETPISSSVIVPDGGTLFRGCVVSKSGDSCTRHDYIPGKRKPDFGDDPMEVDAKPAAVVARTLEMKKNGRNACKEDAEDESTVDVDYESTVEETACHTCCIHCPLLQKYIRQYGECPPEPETNKQEKTTTH